MNDFAATSSFAGITFLAGSSSFVLNGNSITLTSTIDNQSTSLQTINLGLILTANRNVTTTSGDVTINGNISGSGALGKLGNGILTLSGTNTYVGDTNISAGAISVSSFNSISNSGTVQFATGTLIYTGTGETTAQAFNLKTTAAGTINASGSGALILTNGVSESGNKSGVLTLNGSSTANNSVQGPISDSTTAGFTTSLTKDGAGTWILSGTNTYTGGTVVNAGKLALDFGAAGAPASNIINSATTASSLTIRGGGTLEIDGAAGSANTQNFNGLVLGGGNSNKGGGVLTVKSGSGGTVTANLGNITLNNGASLDFQTDGGTTLTTTAGTGVGIYSTRMVWNESDWVTSVGTGTLTMGAYGTLAGSYTALSTSVSNTNNSILTSSASLTASVTTNSLKIAPTASGGILDIGNSRTLTSTSSGLLFNGNNDFSINNGTIRGAAGTEFNIWVYGTGNLIINSIVGTNGTNGLTKAGTGTLVLTGNNTYAGLTYLDAGILSISSNANLGISGTASLYISSGTLQATSTFALDNSGSARNVAIYSGGAAFDVTTGNTLTISGTISDGSTSSIGVLTKIGTGTLALTGNNTHTGGTVVNAGTLLINGSMAAAEATTVNNGGTVGGNGTLNGSLTVASGGVVTPGNGVGVLSSGNFSLQSGGAISMELAGATPGTGYDQLNVTGAVSLAGNLSVSLTFTPTVNDLYFLVLNDGADAITGTFAGLAQGATFSTGGQNFLISYTGDAAGSSFTGGNDVVLMAVSVPEPKAWVLVAAGLSGVLFLRRRKSAA